MTLIPTTEERVKYRAGIQSLCDIEAQVERSIERGTDLDPKTSAFLHALTGTADIENQFHAVSDLLTKTRTQYEDKLLAAAKVSLSCFVEFMTPDEPPAAHHDFLCGKLEQIESREKMRMTVSMPPGHAKSKFCSHYFPAWYLGKRPNHKFVQGGHSQDFVENQFGKRVRGIIREERFRLVFPEVNISSESSAAGFWQIANKRGSYLAKGVGQGIAGFRGNIACVDDPFAKMEDAESGPLRQKVFDWFTADLVTRLLPQSPVFVVSTRWHSDDLCGRLEAMNAGNHGQKWEVINLPAFADTDNDAMGRSLDEPLWPAFFDAEYLLDLRSMMAPKHWNSLYMGQPVDQQGGVLKSDALSRYDTLPTDEKDTNTGVITKKVVRRTTLSVDCASKTTERNDFTVVSVWVEALNDRRHYLADVKRERVEYDDMCKLINDTARRWNADQILVEDKGAGTQYIQQHRGGKAPAPVIAIQVPAVNKAFRFDGVSPMFTAGDVLLPERASWLAEYEKEVMAFPNGTFDDQVDSTSQYLDYVRPRVKLGTVRMKGTH